MEEKKHAWYKIASHIHELRFTASNIAIAEANGKRICIAVQNEVLFAFAYKCPHAGGIMADGYVDALGNVVCPRHRYKFCLKNGRNISGEGYFLTHWPIETRSDGIYVRMEKGFWNIFG